MARRRNEEDQLQTAVAQLLDLYGWCWCHPPNGGARSAVTGAILKRMGAKPGVPDVLVFEPWELPGRQGFGIALELKIKGGRVSPAQHAWLDALRERGWLTQVCRSTNEVHAVLRCCRPLNGRRLRR